MNKMFDILNFIKIIAIISFVATLGGCLQDNITIKLNRDGSGTIEETLILLYDNEKDRKNPEAMIEDVMTAARQNEKDAFGENVKLISVKPVMTDQDAGAKAVYKLRRHK